MVLTLHGHDYKYAVEQVLLTLFPTQRPVYAERGAEAEEPAAEIRLTHGTRYSTAVTVLTYKGRRYRGVAKAKTPDPTDPIVWNRELQKVIKLSFYRAGTMATGQTPPWGALTGIRPGKRATTLLEAGATPAQVKRAFVREYEVGPVQADLCIQTAGASIKAKAALGPKDICLYVGIPFCPTRCAYCSFVAIDVARSKPLIAPFLQALTREIETTAAVVRDLGLNPVSLYIGGGTPTTLSTDALGGLLDTLAANFNLSCLQEYTVEAGRPDTLDPEKLQRLQTAGVTRISINPQSMQDTVLEAIGRGHTAAQVRDAVAQARTVGFPSLNMDLIAGLPGDTPQGFADTLQQVLALGPENITVHTLSRKRGAKISVDDTAAPEADAVATMLDTAQKALPAAGYVPYYLYRQKFTAGGHENVGWCRPGTESLYNIAIMEELSTILSMGGGASTKLVDPHTGRIPRMYNPKFPLEYIEGIERILASKEKIRQFYKQEVLQHATDL